MAIIIPLLLGLNPDMASLKDRFGTDAAKEKEGVWIDVMENDDGSVCRFHLAPATRSNKKLQRESIRVQKRYKHRMGNLTPEEDLKIGVTVFVKSVLLGWENVVEYRKDRLTTQEGFPDSLQMMPFSEENAIFLLTDLPKIFDLLSEEAQNVANFQREAEEEDAKK